MSDIVERLNNELGWGIGPAGLCQEAAAEIVKLRRERDEARALLVKAGTNALAASIDAEAAGYRRGVEDAIAAGDKMAKEGTYGWVWLRSAILALLEQTSEPGEKR